MATIKETQREIAQSQSVPNDATVDSSDEIANQPINFLDAVNVKGSSAEDIDKRFFSGAVSEPDKLKNFIATATGYRSFGSSYYDQYKEQQRVYNPAAILLSEEEFQKKVDLNNTKGPDGENIDDVTLTKFVPFAEGMTYEDKVKAMANNRASQVENDTDINDLPVNNLLTQYAKPVIDKKDPVRLPETEPFYIDVEGNKVALEKRPLFGNVGEEGKIVLDYENPALLFKNFLDKKTDLTEYQKAMLIKAQAKDGFFDTDNSLEAFRTINYTKDIGKMVGNAGLFLIEGAVNTLADLTIGVEDQETPDWLKSLRLPDTHLEYGSEIFSQRTGIDVETSERILDWSPDWMAPIKREFVSGLPVAGVLSFSKLGMGLMRSSGFKTFVKKKYGGKTFDEAFEKAMKDGETYDSMLTGFAETGFNTPFLNSWKKSSTIDGINSVSTIKNYSRSIDTTDLDNMIQAKKDRVAEFANRRTINPKFNVAWKRESDELLELEKRKRDSWLSARVPVKFLNAIKTEAFPAIGVGLSKHTHQEYFEDNNETMFEFGGIALGLFGEKLVLGSSGSMRSVLKGMFTKDISSGKKKIAEDFVGNLYAKSPELAQEFENGITATLALENRLLSLKDVKGQPIITSPDLVTKTIESINVLNILKQTTNSANNSIKAGDAQNFSTKFVDLQTKLIDQKQLNEQLADAVNKLNVAATSPNITQGDLKFINGLKQYAKDSQTSLQKDIADFYTNIDDSTAVLLLRASGAAIGDGRLDDTADLLRTLNFTRRQMDISLGKSSKQITEELNKRLVVFDQAVVDLSNSASNAKRKTTKDMTKITSIAFNVIKENNYQRASNGFNVLREKNKNAFMDASGVLDSMLGNVDDSLLLGTDAAKKIGGTKLAAVQNSNISGVLNDAADNFFNQKPEFTDTINELKLEYPNATSLEIWVALKEQSVAKGENIMKLPLNFVDFELMASGLSSVAFKGKGTRGSLPVKEIRDSLLKAGSDNVTGFKVGFFDSSGGVLISDKVMGDYKKVRKVYQDYQERYDKGTIGSKWNNSIASKSDDGIIYKSGENPANWVSKEINKYITDNKVTSLSTDFMSDMASVFNGRKVTTGGAKGQVSYEFIEGSKGLLAFKSLMKNNLKLMSLNSNSGGKIIQKLRDNPVYKEKFLTSKQIMDGRELVGGGNSDNFSAVMSEMRNATMVTKEGKVVPMFSVEDINSVYDVNGVEELVRVSKEAKLYVNKAMDDVKVIADEIRKPDSSLAKDLKADSDLMIKYGSQLNPSTISKALSEGTVGLNDLDSVRRGYIRNLKQRGITGKTFDDNIKRYDKIIAKQALEHIQTGSVKNVPGASGTVAKPIPTSIDPSAMWKKLGGEESTQETQAIMTILNRATGSDDLFNNLKSIATIMNTRMPGASSGVGFTGIPRGLSVESYISRVYSMAREVVSFKYVATEAVLQTMRLRKFNSFQAMIDHPEIAEHVVKIMKSGKPLSAKMETNFLQLMTNAVAKQVVRYESVEGSKLNPNAGEGFFSTEGDGVIANYHNYVKEGADQGFLIGGIDRQAMKVAGDGEYLTPNLLKVITPQSSVGEKFDVRKKPEFLGGEPDVDFSAKPLTATEELFGRVVR